MRRLVVTEFLTLDGRFEAPEKWSFPYQTSESTAIKLGELETSDSLLLGAATYRIFAGSWPERSGDFADHMNGIAKVVVSSKLKSLTWNNSHRVEGDIAASVAALKREPGKDILVAGSAKLADLLLKAKLVDVLRLMIHPIVLGEGRRLFHDGTLANLRLADMKQFSTGMIVLEYQPENNQIAKKPKEIEMSKVISKDGVEIFYDKRGSGPAVILVDGAMTYRQFGGSPHVAERLAPEFTVYNYDRRGRGESGNSPTTTLQNEIDDIEALIDEAGGEAYVYGISSGAALAMEAALKLGDKIKKLAMFEAPYNGEARAQWETYVADVKKAIAEGRPGDAVGYFMLLVGMPEADLQGMKQSPMWPMFEAIGPTLLYDAAALGETRAAPVDRAKGVKSKTLVMDGGANLQIMPFMNETAVALAKAIPGATHKTLPDQTHDVKPEVVAAEIAAFFKA